MNDLVINKIQSIQRGIQRAREEYGSDPFEEVIESTANLTLEESQAFVSEIERLLQP